MRYIISVLAVVLFSIAPYAYAQSTDALDADKECLKGTDVQYHCPLGQKVQSGVDKDKPCLGGTTCQAKEQGAVGAICQGRGKCVAQCVGELNGKCDKPQLPEDTRSSLGEGVAAPDLTSGYVAPADVTEYTLVEPQTEVPAEPGAADQALPDQNAQGDAAQLSQIARQTDSGAVTDAGDGQTGYVSAPDPSIQDKINQGLSYDQFSNLVNTGEAGMMPAAYMMTPAQSSFSDISSMPGDTGVAVVDCSSGSCTTSGVQATLDQAQTQLSQIQQELTPAAFTTFTNGGAALAGVTPVSLSSISTGTSVGTSLDYAPYSTASEGIDYTQAAAEDVITQAQQQGTAPALIPAIYQMPTDELQQYYGSLYKNVTATGFTNI